MCRPRRTTSAADWERVPNGALPNDCGMSRDDGHVTPPVGAQKIRELPNVPDCRLSVGLRVMLLCPFLFPCSRRCCTSAISFLFLFAVFLNICFVLIVFHGAAGFENSGDPPNRSSPSSIHHHVAPTPRPTLITLSRLPS